MERVEETEEVPDYLTPDPSLVPARYTNTEITSYLTKYEIARLLSSRAKDLSNSAEPYIPLKDCHGKREHVIAFEELQAKKIPYYIRRYLPGGSFIDVRATDLKFVRR